MVSESIGQGPRIRFCSEFGLSESAFSRSSVMLLTKYRNRLSPGERRRFVKFNKNVFLAVKSQSKAV